MLKRKNVNRFARAMRATIFLASVVLGTASVRGDEVGDLIDAAMKARTSEQTPIYAEGSAAREWAAADAAFGVTTIAASEGDHPVASYEVASRAIETRQKLLAVLPPPRIWSGGDRLGGMQKSTVLWVDTMQAAPGRTRLVVVTAEPDGSWRTCLYNANERPIEASVATNYLRPKRFDPDRTLVLTNIRPENDLRLLRFSVIDAGRPVNAILTLDRDDNLTWSGSGEIIRKDSGSLRTVTFDDWWPTAAPVVEVALKPTSLNVAKGDTYYITQGRWACHGSPVMTYGADGVVRFSTGYGVLAIDPNGGPAGTLERYEIPFVDTGFMEPVRCISADGRQAMLRRGEQWWVLRRGEHQWTVIRRFEPVEGVAAIRSGVTLRFCADGKRAYVSTPTGVAAYPTDSETASAVFRPFTDAAADAPADEKIQRLVLDSVNLLIWTEAGRPKESFAYLPGDRVKDRGAFASVSPDGKLMAVARLFDLCLFDLETRTLVWAQPFSPTGSPLNSLAWSNDGRRLAAYSYDYVLVLDLTPLPAVWRLPKPGWNPGTHTLAFDPTGRRLVGNGMLCWELPARDGMRSP